VCVCACACLPRNVLLPNFIGIVIVWYCAKHTGTVTSIIIAGACPPMIHSRRQYLSISDDLKFADNEDKCLDMGKSLISRATLANSSDRKLQLKLLITINFPPPRLNRLNRLNAIANSKIHCRYVYVSHTYMSARFLLRECFIFAACMKSM